MGIVNKPNKNKKIIKIQRIRVFNSRKDYRHLKKLGLNTVSEHYKLYEHIR